MSTVESTRTSFPHFPSQAKHYDIRSEVIDLSHKEARLRQSTVLRKSIPHSWPGGVKLLGARKLARAASSPIPLRVLCGSKSGFHASAEMTTGGQKELWNWPRRSRSWGNWLSAFSSRLLASGRAAACSLATRKMAYRPSARRAVRAVRVGRNTTYFVPHGCGTRFAFLPRFTHVNGRYTQFRRTCAVRKCQNAIDFVTG